MDVVSSEALDTAFTRAEVAEVAEVAAALTAVVERYCAAVQACTLLAAAAAACWSEIAAALVAPHCTGP
eukprot:2705-Heterococcus_DN1.PRE.13